MVSSLTPSPPRLPGGGGQCDEQGLEDATDEDDGVLFGDEEVEQGQDEEAMDDQPAHHGDCIEAQLLSYGRGVVHLQDLASDEKHDAKGEVPGVGRAAGSPPSRQKPWEAPGTTSLPGLSALSLPGLL